MRKFLSLIFAVFMTVMAFGQSYGILVNGTTYFAGTPKGLNFEGYDEFLAPVQLKAGDYCQLYDADNKAAWAVDLNPYSVEGFTRNGDHYEVAVTGCYDFYIQLKYGADRLYIGDGSDCGEGVEIGGGSEVDPNQMYVWNGISVTSAEDAIEKGGKAEAVQADGNNIAVGAAQKGNWCLKANKGFNSGAYYLGIAMDNAVNAGDTVKIAYFRTSASNSYVLGMDFSADKASASTAHQILTEGDPQVLASVGVPAESTFIIPEGVESAKYMRIYRNSGSTGLWVAKVELVKAAGTSVDPGDDPIVETKDLKVDPNGVLEAGDKLAVWAWKTGSDGAWFVVDATTHIAKIPAEADMVIVAIFKEADELKWDNVIVNSADMPIQECGIVYLNLKDQLSFTWCEPAGDEPGEKIENPIFTVIVPEGTDSVFVAGSFDEWASFRKLSAVEGKDNQFTIQIEGEFEAIEYKYLAGPDWKYVEVREGGANRTFVVDALDEVSAWTSVPEGGEEPPTPGKEGYALLVNGTEFIDLVHGEEYEGYDQWFVEGAALKAGDVVKVHNYATEASWAIGILNPASSKHVANSEDGLVFDKDGEYTIYLKLKFEADEIYVAPLPDEGGDDPVADGFYLIGTFNDWTPSAQYAFVLNPDAAPAVEYMVSVDLQEGDKLKGLAVIMGQWIYYPEGDDIVVPAEYAGKCTIYFRPEYNPDWAAFGGHIYIAKQSGQGIDEILSEGKAVKVLREGQVLIMKGNRTYTPMGQLVK